MNNRSGTVLWRRLTGVAVMTALLTAVATPAFAAPPPVRSSSPITAESVDKAVAPVVEHAAKPAPKEGSSAAEAPAKTQASGSFMKSRTGLMVLAVFAVGTGYAIYSAREDRIRGRNR